MIRYATLTLLLCLWTLCAGAAAPCGELTVATLEWEPYIGSGIPGNGYVGRVVREAFARGGYDATFLFLPWARVLDKAAHGEVQAYGPEYFDPALQKLFAFSDPFPGGPLGLFALADSEISYRSIPDLRPYSIAVVRGYVNTPELDGADYLRKQFVTSDALGLQMLMNRRVDLMVADKYVGRLLLRRMYPKRFMEVDFLDPPLAVKPLYLCFPLVREDHAELLEVFNKGLRSMREDGTLDELRQTLDR